MLRSRCHQEEHPLQPGPFDASCFKEMKKRYLVYGYYVYYECRILVWIYFWLAVLLFARKVDVLIKQVFHRTIPGSKYLLIKWFFDQHFFYQNIYWSKYCLIKIFIDQAIFSSTGFIKRCFDENIFWSNVFLNERFFRSKYLL